MVFHPRDPNHRRLTRRDFLRRSLATGVALPSTAAILAACASEQGGGGGTATDTGQPEGPLFGTPENPVRLQTWEDVPPIASDLEPEAGPLVIYNWEQYIWKKVLDDFSKKYDVEWRYETFYNMEEAIQKIQTGQVEFDVFFPTIDVVPKLVAAKLLQPLNHDYIPNMKNVWPALQDPFYDQGAQYTVPYTIYHTGIAWRTDLVPYEPEDLPTAYDNSWQILWDTDFKGITGVYDDYREALALGMLVDLGEATDVNTSDPAVIEAAKQRLLELNDTMDVRYTIDGAYAGIPEGKFGLHQSWSGDIQAGPWYVGSKEESALLRYTWPARDGFGGTIGNDTMAIPTSAKNPVLAHLFLNFMLDEFEGIKNWTWVGYQVPFNVVEPETIFDEGYPGLEGWFSWEYRGRWDNLRSTIVTQEDFEIGKRAIGLPVQVDTLYQNAFAEVKAG
ncbi:MAG: ABC transporter substrate-binding protein [Actinomycetota bacterium]|jgi:spermidine/putrescine transport system substrate-binding protein|nr:MAG: ABC transporter substrate-binding protein [Actinomycetota bacterium]